MTVERLKQDLVDTLDSLNKDQMDLCSLKEYAEIVKIVSETKGKDYIEILATMLERPMPDPMSYGFNSPRALGPRTIREMREMGKTEEEDDD